MNNITTKLVNVVLGDPVQGSVLVLSHHLTMDLFQSRLELEVIQQLALQLVVELVQLLVVLVLIFLNQFGEDFIDSRNEKLVDVEIVLARGLVEDLRVHEGGIVLFVHFSRKLSEVYLDLQLQAVPAVEVALLNQGHVSPQNCRID